MPFKWKFLEQVVCLVAQLAHSKAGSRALPPTAQAHKHPPTPASPSLHHRRWLSGARAKKVTLLFQLYVIIEPIDQNSAISSFLSHILRENAFLLDMVLFGHWDISSKQMKWNAMKPAQLVHSSSIIWFVSGLGCPALNFARARLGLCFCSSTLPSPVPLFTQGWGQDYKKAPGWQWHCVLKVSLQAHFFQIQTILV